MKLTNSTLKRIAELFSGQRGFNLFGVSERSRVELIAGIRASGEPGAASYLAVYAVGAEGSTRDEAAKGAAALVAPLRLDELLRLDQDVRRMFEGPNNAYLAWKNLDPGQLARLQGLPSGAESLFGIFSFHQNGHVREAAVRLLAWTDSGAELPFLLIRLNDWVPAVRNLARAAIQARLTPAYARHFGACIVLVRHMTSWKRADHSSVFEWITDYLRRPECGAAVAELLVAGDMKTRRLIFGLLARPQQPGFTALLQQALRDRHPTIRLWSISQARKSLAGADAAAMARIAIKDKYSRVRAQAAYVYAEQLAGESEPVFRAALMDASPTLRGIARFHLGKIEATDFAAFYRPYLGASSAREQVIAISALGDVGSAADAQLLAPCAQDPRIQVRTAALHALDKLDGDRFVEQFVPALLEGPPSVAKVAARALSNRVALVDLDMLWREFSRVRAGVARNGVLGLLFNASKWDSLYYAIALSSHPDHAVAATAHGQVRRWIQDVNRSGLQATPAQRERILGALAAHAQALPRGMAEQIRFLSS
jgi:HEAT repeat protein